MASIKELHDKYYKKIAEIYNAIYSEELNQQQLDKLMHELYTEVRNAGYDFYINDKVDIAYFDLVKKVNSCELAMPQKYICDIKSNFEEEFNPDSIKKENFSSYEDILNYIVLSVRKCIYMEANPFSFVKYTPFDDIDVTNKCDECSEMISFISQKLNIKEKRIKINPAFDNVVKLYEGNGYHYFNLVTIDRKEYIVDCTYKQFFMLYQSYIERLGLVYSSGCSAGIYMLYDESHAKTALTLINQGWIEATDENFKNYLDGFAISYRNGIYYDENNETDYQTDYSAQEYREMLFGKKSQLDYEATDWLGYQKKPLNNHELKFTKKPTTKYYKIS